MNSPWRYAVSCVGLATIVFFFNLGGPKLWDRDEPRNAGCAREMIERNDWVTPYFNGELRDHKPVLLYWFMMSAYAVFGVNEFAARFWSAVLGVGTVMLTFDLGRRWFGPRTSFWAGVMLSTCMMFPVAARAATPDSVLIFFSTAALWLYAGPLLASTQHGGSPERHPTEKRFRFWQIVGSYALMGLAVLAKGPIGVVLPVGIIFLFHLWRDELEAAPLRPSGQSLLRKFLRFLHPNRIWAVMRRMHLGVGIIVVLLVAMPWYLWVGLRTDGAWLRGFFLTHNVNRFLEPMEGHRGPLFFYLLVFFASFFPWSFLIIPAVPSFIRSLRSRDRMSDKLAFLTVWIGVYIGFFSLAGTKLPSYITPCFPAIALILGWWLDRWLSGGEAASKGVLTGITVVYGVVGVVLLIALPLAANRFLPGEEILGTLGVIWLVGSIVAMLALGRGQRIGYAGALATTAWLFAVGAFGVAAARVSHHQQVDQLMACLKSLSPSPQVASYDCLEPSWVFYLSRPITFIPASDTQRLVEFVKKSESACVLTTRDRYERIRAWIPSDVTVVAEIPYFLRDQQLVLLGGKEVLARCKPIRSETPCEQSQRIAEGNGGPLRR